MIKNIYFNTFKLTDGWMGDTDVKKKLIDAFKSAGNPHTYILLLKPETSFNYSQEFLKLAILNQQLRSGIRVIEFSTVVGCQVYSGHLQAGASLISFGLSTTYAPETPSPYYKSKWRAAALYLDGLTYITKDGSEMPSDYILSRIQFTLTEPTSSPIESIAVLDCSKNVNTGIGSWIRNREERLKLDSINSTIVGRTVKVGVIKYGPFYDNGCGFSVPIMEALKTSAKVNLVVVEYDFNSDDPYYLKMQTALKDGDIDIGLAPVPLGALDLQNVGRISATITTSYMLLRQRPDRPSDFLLILRPLSMPVWLGSVVLAFIFMGLLMLFGHLRPVIVRNLAEGQMSTKRDLFEVSALGVASSFSLTKLQIIPITLSNRIFALTMWLFSYLLLVLYASAMMTILLRIRKPSNADITVREVLDPLNCDKVIVIQNGISYEEITSSLVNMTQKYTPVAGLDAAYAEVMKSKNTVLLASSIEASYLSVTNCNLETIPYTAMYETILTFPYRKLWSLGSQLDFYFSVISESGVLSKASSVYFETGRCYLPSYNAPEPVVLELGDTASIYIFLLIGIIIAFIILGAEILAKYYLGEKEEKVYNALDMGLREGDTIEVTYFGKGGDGKTELFCRYFPE
ncbi:unnamed protein product [Hymenolepis diminuta]|uniref:Ionotropic glutamate receptor C-terminal domain-containing protein n=3 Tax=Hymenolepis diminuta TaxID=6216 RepID=A0A3P7AS22_HYMDI|nr:unnamed protein product [Hymenolepis diminuta]